MILLANDEIGLTRAEFRDLLEYSTSLPTGQTPGKRWRRAIPAFGPGRAEEWWQGCFGEPYPEGHEHHGSIPIGWRRIRVLGSAPRWPSSIRVPLRPIPHRRSVDL